MRKSWLHRLLVIFPDRRAAVSPMLALMMVPLIGAMSMATEASSWFLIQRAAQNAADAAALAAAANGCDTSADCYTVQKSATYADEAKSVAASYNFTDGANNATVTATKLTTGCPANPGNTNVCYQVTITKLTPVSLVQLVGYTGTAGQSVNGGPAQLIQATAIASASVPLSYCLTALGTSSTAIQFTGASKLNLTGCNVASNGGASCNGQSGTSISFADVVTTSNNKICGTERGVSTAFPDNFSALDTAANIPPANNTTCPGGYPQAIASGKNKNQVVTANRISGSTTSFSTASPKCGDVQLTGNVTLTSDSVLLINNGRLDLNGFTLTTNGAALTIIFSGAAGAFEHHVVDTSSGTAGALDYSAPSSGTWQGIAMYQAPGLTTTVAGGLDFAYSGSSPTFKITGLIYAPDGNVALAGAIDHATSGLACLAFVAKTITVAGTASIFADPTIACNRLNLALGGVQGTQLIRQALVQ